MLLANTFVFLDVVIAWLQIKQLIEVLFTYTWCAENHCVVTPGALCMNE